MEASLKDRLIKILVDAEHLRSEDISRAIEIQKKKGGTLSETLIELGLISKDELMLVLSQGLGVPPINLSRYKIDPLILKLISPRIATHYRIIPISKIGDVLTVAISDPLNIFALDEIKALTGLKITPLITTEKDINDAIRQYYQEDASLAMDKIMGDMGGSKGAAAAEREEAGVRETSGELLRISQEAPVVTLANVLLAQGVNLKASDILVEPLENQMRIRFRVDGILHEWKRPPKTMHKGVVSRFKVMSELNIAESRLPQDGRFKVKIHGREVDFRISVLPSSEGEKVALRILDKAQATLEIEKLGFDSRTLAELKKAAARPHGMILVCGPTGCGKTTTLYSVLKYVDSPMKNIVTVEDPVEYLLDGINQVTARPGVGLTFARALRAILRQDPDVVMVGEIRDPETADIAIKSALTGHLVLSTLHTTTASGSIVRLLDMGLEPFLINASLELILAQRLVRRICGNCRESYKIDEAICKELRLKPEEARGTFYRGRGCEACLGTGYRGRVAIAEVLPLRPKIKEALIKGANEHAIREIARSEGMPSLRENGIKKVLEGSTTVDEVLRVTSGEQDMELKW